MGTDRKQTVKVSIVCTVYNHSPYLRKCLDGFVMQNTNFKFEAIVHDDASTDSSATIIKEYADKYPGIIVPIYEDENLYSRHDGSIGRVVSNYITGKYVAYCEGDDYWTDPTKLQKQYDMMEANPNMAICFHSNYELFPNGSMKEHRPKNVKDRFSLDEAILGGVDLCLPIPCSAGMTYLGKKASPNTGRSHL